MSITINKLYQASKAVFKLLGQSQKIDSYFRLQDFASSLSRIYFNSKGLAEEEKRNFFKNKLQEIELETHAYCNRKCEFCPNKSIDRTDKNQVLPVGVFNRLINELSDIDFQGTLKFHRYNEPLALDIIFDRITYAREKLPKANLGFSSNGDYITPEILERCEQIGLNFIFICRYLSSEIPRRRIRVSARQHCEQYLKKHNLKAKSIQKSPGNLARYKILMKTMHVILFVPDLKKYGDDRGGFLKELSTNKIRTSPCLSPFKNMFIDWTGDVLPCCSLRSDIETHKNYILGNIKNSTLQDIFFSDVSNKVRRMLADFSEKQGPCRHCRADLFYSSNTAQKLMEETLSSLGI